MTKDDKAPATKKDIRLLMQQMAAFYEKMERRNEQWKLEIIGEFHIVVGQLRHDFKGAFGDKLAQHEDRIVRLERHTGLLAA
jgi:hypothetical protein